MEKKLSENWIELSIGAISNVGSSKRIYKSEYVSEGVPFYRSKEIIDKSKGVNPKIELFIPFEKYQNLKFKFGSPNEGDILLTAVGTIGISYVVKDEGDFYFKDGNLIWFKDILKGINSDYLKFWLDSENGQKRLQAGSIGSNQRALTIREVKNVKFPLPPLPEQQRIVAKLDELFGHLDHLKTRLNDIPQILKNFRQAVLTQAVTGKLTKEWRKGKKLEEWEETTVGKFMIEVKNKMNPMESDATNYIGLEHLLKNGGVINKSTSEDLKSSKTVFKKGDVLYGKLRPYLNKHDVVTFDGVCSTDILVYRNDFEDSSYFFNYYLGTESFIQKANSESKGINLPRVSSKTINQFSITVPPKEEQTEIVKRVKFLFAKADAIESLYQSLKTKIDSLPQAILAKAFKGELVEQLPTDGDANELLEEIKRLRAAVVSKKKVTIQKMVKTKIKVDKVTTKGKTKVPVKAKVMAETIEPFGVEANSMWLHLKTNVGLKKFTIDQVELPPKYSYDRLKEELFELLDKCRTLEKGPRLVQSYTDDHISYQIKLK
ncbi:restriction endonuclease subunit S [Polaribacter sp. Asnod1-A03]|uniref:restriction endonuclease subunit S n=1 Tax=Polaribacter sp. Asnod1-A03 TaxID=3160581 RepID=UPI0038671F8C